MDDTVVAVTRHKLDVDDYYRMADAGILGEDDRVELIDGEIIDMPPIGQGHAATVNGLTKALVLACGDKAIVSTQNPVRLDRLNEPQPDFAVYWPREDFYATGERPGPADALLVVEVADSSLRFDQSVKLPLYARAGIVEFWIVDMKRRLVDIYRDPTGSEYKTRLTYQPGDRVALAAAPDIVVTLAFAFG